MNKQEIIEKLENVKQNTKQSNGVGFYYKVGDVLMDELIQSLTEPSSKSSKRLDHICRSIVNGLYELAELDVKKRQDLNDRADEYVLGILESLTEPAEVSKVSEHEASRKYVEIWEELTTNGEFSKKGLDLFVFKQGFMSCFKWMQEYATQNNTEAKKAREYTSETLEELNAEIEQDKYEELKQRAIGFAIWIDDDGYFKDIERDIWISYQSEYEYTDSQLYEAYLTTLKQ